MGYFIQFIATLVNNTDVRYFISKTVSNFLHDCVIYYCYRKSRHELKMILLNQELSSVNFKVSLKV